MMRARIVILISIFAITVSSYGQNKVERDVSVGLGYNFLKLKDSNVSPLIYSAHAAGLNLGYSAATDRYIWHIGLKPSVGTNQSKRFGKRKAIIYDPYNLDGDRDSVIYDLNPLLSFAQINFEAGYSRYIQIPDLYVGGALKATFIYSAMGADVWFFNQVSFMMKAVKNIELKNGNHILLNFSTPLISHLVRQPYSHDPSLQMENGIKSYLIAGSNLALIPEFMQINMGVLYRWQAIAISYQFLWTNYRNIDNRPLKYYSNELSLSYVF